MLILYSYPILEQFWYLTMTLLVLLATKLQACVYLFLMTINFEVIMNRETIKAGVFRLRREHQHPQDPDAEAHLLPMLQTRTPSARMDPPAGSFLPGDSFVSNLPENRLLFFYWDQ